MLTHFNLVSNTLMCSEWIGQHDNPTYLSILPLFHIYGMTTGLNAPLHVEQWLCYSQHLTQTSPAGHKKISYNRILRSPTLYAKLLSEQDLKKFDYSTFNTAFQDPPLFQQIYKNNLWTTSEVYSWRVTVYQKPHRLHIATSNL